MDFVTGKGCMLIQAYDLYRTMSPYSSNGMVMKAIVVSRWTFKPSSPTPPVPVVMKPTSNIQELCESLEKLGINFEHDIRFVEDNWENPSTGSAGLGWEVWLDGMEITQFTYFQQVGGLATGPVTSGGHLRIWNVWLLTSKR